MEIVVAEDDTLCREMIASSLSAWGFDVSGVDDGAAACELLQGSGRPKLAVLDWQMPKMDGVEACRRIREQRPLDDLFILMLTTRACKADLAHALECGASDYLTKPYDPVELRARVQVGQRLVGCQLAANSDGSVNRATAGQSPAAASSRDSSDPAARQLLHDSLSSDFLMPIFDPKSMEYSFGVLSTVLRAWEKDGTLERVLLDRVQKCPKCRGMPTFCFGCPSCGSAHVTNERLVHHFACAHIGPADEFEETGELVCPKCHARDLAVGADFEHMNGPYRCLGCDWTASELEHIGHCIRCGFRFPAKQAYVEDLIGYHVHRMDVLAADAATA